MLTSDQQLDLRRLSVEVERQRWIRASANPLHASERRGTYAVTFYTRLSNRSLAARVSAAYYAPELRQRRLADAADAAALDAAIVRWTISDLGQRAVQDAYGKRASVIPAAAYWQPFAASMLAAVAHLRRWRWLSLD